MTRNSADNMQIRSGQDNKQVVAEPLRWPAVQAKIEWCEPRIHCPRDVMYCGELWIPEKMKQLFLNNSNFTLINHRAPQYALILGKHILNRVTTKFKNLNSLTCGFPDGFQALNMYNYTLLGSGAFERILLKLIHFETLSNY